MGTPKYFVKIYNYGTFLLQIAWRYISPYFLKDKEELKQKKLKKYNYQTRIFQIERTNKKYKFAKHNKKNPPPKKK